MEFEIHRADERGRADHGWLKANHSFSFASYYRPDRMRFGALLVMNDDEIAPAMGFGTHPHDNMEIITVPLEGVVAHRDSMGHEGTVTAGEVQVMTAGTGVQHSEFNGSATALLRLFQLWIIPRERGLPPAYDQQEYARSAGGFTVLAGPDGREGSLTINQDALVARGSFAAGSSGSWSVAFPGNGVYLMVVEGRVRINGEELGRRDAAAITAAEVVSFEALEDADLLCVEVPMI